MELREASGQWLQVNPVYAWRRVLKEDGLDGVLEVEEEEEEDRFLSEDVLAFHRGNDVAEFAFDRMIKRVEEDDCNGSPTNEFASIWVRRTILRTATPLPGILQWAPVASFQTREISPLSLAIEKVEEKNRELRRMIDAFHIEPHKVNINQLSMKLNGVIDAAVMGGTANYEEAFCGPTYLDLRPEQAHLVARLQELLASQIPILEEGLRIHGDVVPLDLRPFHEKLRDCFRSFKSRVVTAYGDRPAYSPPRRSRRRPPPTFPWVGHRDKSGSIAHHPTMVHHSGPAHLIPSHNSSKSNSPGVRTSRTNNAHTYRSPRAYNRSPSNRSSNSSTDSGVAATSAGSGGFGGGFGTASCAILPEFQSSSTTSLQYMLGSHFNQADSSGFLDDSRLSTSTWADPVSAAASATGTPAATPRGLRPFSNRGLGVSNNNGLSSSTSFNQMAGPSGHHLMSTSMSFTLPNNGKVTKSNSAQTLSGPLKSAMRATNYSSVTLGRNLKTTLASWTTLRKKRSGSQPDLGQLVSDHPIRSSTTSTFGDISEIATRKANNVEAIAKTDPNSHDSKKPSDVASTEPVNKTVKSSVIELTEDLKPRRPLRPRPRGEASRDRGMSVSRLQTLKTVDSLGSETAERGVGEGRGGRLLHSRSNPNLSQAVCVSVDSESAQGPVEKQEDNEFVYASEDSAAKQSTREKQKNTAKATSSFMSFLDVPDVGKPPRPSTTPRPKTPQGNPPRPATPPVRPAELSTPRSSELSSPRPATPPARPATPPARPSELCTPRTKEIKKSTPTALKSIDIIIQAT